MALEKDIPQASGISALFWRRGRIEINEASGGFAVNWRGYVSKAAYLDGAEPLTDVWVKLPLASLAPLKTQLVSIIVAETKKAVGWEDALEVTDE